MAMTATVPTPTEVSAAGRNPAIGLLRTMRPRQWVKNVLVLAAPFASRDIIELDVIVAVALAFVAFSLAASGVYLVNDVKDVEADRAHPTKRIRPIAAGIVAPRVAMGAAVVLFAVSLGVSWLASDQLLVAAFGSLFMVAGKRYAEIRLAERTGAKIRRSLESYTASYLRFVWTLSATVLIITYSLWAFEISDTNDSVWPVISLVPFVIAVLRYAVDVDGGNGGGAAEVALGDRGLPVLRLPLI